MAYCVRCGRDIPGGSPNCPACGAAQGPGSQYPHAAAGQKNFFALFFDFSFSEFVAPRIARVLYIVLVISLLLAFLVGFVSIMSVPSWFMDAGVKFLYAFIILPLLVFLYLMIIRFGIETAMVMFKIYDELKDMKRK